MLTHNVLFSESCRFDQLIEEESGPRLLSVLGGHASTLSQISKNGVRNPAVEEGLRRFLRYLRALLDSGPVSDRESGAFSSLRRRMEVDAVSFRAAEDVLKAQLADAHRAILTERTAREALERDCMALRAELQQLQLQASQGAAELAHWKQKSWDTWDRAVKQTAQERLVMCQPVVQMAKAYREEMAVLKNDLRASKDDIKSLSEARQSNENALREAQRVILRADQEVTALQARDAAAGHAGNALLKQVNDLSVSNERLKAELALTENLLAIVDAMPKQFRGKGLHAKGSWQDPSPAYETEEQKAILLTKRAEGLVRHHVVSGYTVGSAVRSALKRAIGTAKAEVLRDELGLDDASRMRTHVSISDVPVVGAERAYSNLRS